jgi:site-specific recombinase
MDNTFVDSVLGCVLMGVISLPVSFFLARYCLRGVIRIVTGGENRDVL